MVTRRWWVPFASVALLLALLRASVVPVEAADPLRVLLLVDSSTNMSGMITEFRSGLHTFIDEVPPDVEIVMVSTGGQLRVRVPPTLDRKTLHDAASRFASDGGANSLIDTLVDRGLTTDPPALGDPPLDRYNRFVQDFLRRRGRAHGIVIRNAAQYTGLASAILDNLTGNTDGVLTILAVGNSLSTRMREMAEQVAAQN